MSWAHISNNLYLMIPPLLLLNFSNHLSLILLIQQIISKQSPTKLTSFATTNSSEFIDISLNQLTAFILTSDCLWCHHHIYTFLLFHWTQLPYLNSRKDHQPPNTLSLGEYLHINFHIWKLPSFHGFTMVLQSHCNRNNLTSIHSTGAESKACFQGSFKNVIIQ